MARKRKPVQKPRKRSPGYPETPESRRYKALKAKRHRQAVKAGQRLQAYWASLKPATARRKRKAAAKKAAETRRRIKAAKAAQIEKTAEHVGPSSHSETFCKPMEGLRETIDALAEDALRRIEPRVPVAFNYKFLFRSTVDGGQQWVSTALILDLERAKYEAESIVEEFNVAFQYGRVMEPIQACITVWTYLKGAS
jgi:hypothetical protein